MVKIQRRDIGTLEKVIVTRILEILKRLERREKCCPREPSRNKADKKHNFFFPEVTQALPNPKADNVRLARNGR
jgi:hypothetical protein